MPNVVPRLMVRDAAGHEREVEITQTPFTLGRQSDNDLVLLDNRISRQHARIVYDGHGYILEDSSSRHGTYVNGERIERCRLKDGDQLSLGVWAVMASLLSLKKPPLRGCSRGSKQPRKALPRDCNSSTSCSSWPRCCIAPRRWKIFSSPWWIPPCNFPGLTAEFFS